MSFIPSVVYLICYQVSILDVCNLFGTLKLHAPLNITSNEYIIIINDLDQSLGFCKKVLRKLSRRPVPKVIRPTTIIVDS